MDAQTVLYEMAIKWNAKAKAKAKEASRRECEAAMAVADVFIAAMEIQYNRTAVDDGDSLPF